MLHCYNSVVTYNSDLPPYSLRHLKLQHYKWEFDKRTNVSLPQLTRFSALKHLNLGGCIIDESSSIELSHSLQSLTALQSMSLTSSDLKHEGCEALMTHLSALKSLQVLNLNYKLLCDVGAKALATSLLHLTAQAPASKERLRTISGDGCVGWQYHCSNCTEDT